MILKAPLMSLTGKAVGAELERLKKDYELADADLFVIFKGVEQFGTGKSQLSLMAAAGFMEGMKLKEPELFEVCIKTPVMFQVLARTMMSVYYCGLMGMMYTPEEIKALSEGITRKMKESGEMADLDAKLMQQTIDKGKRW
jgi:hypothetical protein